jgi:RHS repeat-associated protein
LTYASNGTTNATFYYDGKNRQIARNINGAIRFNSWDGWDLLEEYSSSLNVATAYLQGSTGVIKSWSAANTLYYYQDKLGSTTHVANALGQLVESFHYGLAGTPTETSTHGVIDLYAGERWIPELALYDLRNRFMSPELGRFLQADPIGFQGDASNLYRYCGNDPVDRSDPSGLVSMQSGSTIEERMRLFYGDNAGGSLSELNHRNQANVTMGYRSVDSGNAAQEYKSAREAANSRINKIGEEITASKETEWVSEVGQAVDQKGHNVPNRYISNEPHRGRGVGNVETKRFKGKAQNSLVNQSHLPQGYRLVGFVLGHVYKDSIFAQRDLDAAKDANYQVAIIVSPKRAGEKFYPIDVYER